jgi:septal ring factor EnvC (AmiA/AmiB activator)
VSDRTAALETTVEHLERTVADQESEIAALRADLKAERDARATLEARVETVEHRTGSRRKRLGEFLGFRE